MKTVFYAWQSDRPNNTNRSFLEECLERAIKKANEKRPTPERLTLDRDTQGVAGMPVISDTIFEKISQCAVFVPDLSFVTPPGASRAISNPNVLIELGYALKAIGDRRIVALFNTAFGPTSELPFDLRTRRFPFDYHVAETDSADSRRAVRDELVRRLASALADAADLASVEPEPPPEKAPLHASAALDDSTFVLANSPVVAEVTSRGNDGAASEHVYWHLGPSAWLRVLPTKPLDLSRAKLRAIVEQSPMPLEPFGDAQVRHRCVNQYGMIVLGFDGEVAETHATRLTQVFRTGEIWGLNKQLIESPSATPRQRFLIPWPDLAVLFERGLQSYLSFARQTLRLELPLIVTAGLAMVNDAVLVRKRHGYTGPETTRCMERSIHRQWTIESFDIEPNQIFRDLYAAIWDACGGLDFSEETGIQNWPR